MSSLTREEWESLCDGCAQCCIIKFEDEDSGRIYHTNVVCEYLEIFHCRCTRYSERSILVPMCVTLTPELAGSLPWMPETCAYRLLAEGDPSLTNSSGTQNSRDLPMWHPLVSGDPHCA